MSSVEPEKWRETPPKKTSPFQIDSSTGYGPSASKWTAKHVNRLCVDYSDEWPIFGTEEGDDNDSGLLPPTARLDGDNPIITYLHGEIGLPWDEIMNRNHKKHAYKGLQQLGESAFIDYRKVKPMKSSSPVPPEDDSNSTAAVREKEDSSNIPSSPPLPASSPPSVETGDTRNITSSTGGGDSGSDYIPSSDPSEQLRNSGNRDTDDGTDEKTVQDAAKAVISTLESAFEKVEDSEFKFVCRSGPRNLIVLEDVTCSCKPDLQVRMIPAGEENADRYALAYGEVKKLKHELSPGERLGQETATLLALIPWRETSWRRSRRQSGENRKITTFIMCWEHLKGYIMRLDTTDEDFEALNGDLSTAHNPLRIRKSLELDLKDPNERVEYLSVIASICLHISRRHGTLHHAINRVYAARTRSSTPQETTSQQQSSEGSSFRGFDDDWP